MPAHSAPHRILVIANLNRRLKHWVSDTDEAVKQARARLASLVADLRDRGIATNGDIGDAAPLQAIDDALAGFDADELILSTHPPGRSHWLEKRLVERATERFDGDVSHLVSAYGAVTA